MSSSAPLPASTDSPPPETKYLPPPTHKFMFTNRFLRAAITLSSAAFIIAGTFIAIQFAKGYRLTRQGSLAGTGLLAANSSPQGARIYIDGTFTNKVTDITLNQDPGSYTVKLEKDGYNTWEKTLTVEPEIVTSTNAQLFRTVPSLSPLTFSGASNLHPSPDGQKIAFTIASPSASLKDGLYILELTDNPLTFSKSPRQIAENPPGHSFKTADLLWSPDSSQILVTFPTASYLLDVNTRTAAADYVNISRQLPLTLKAWEDEITLREKQLLATLPDPVLAVATQSAKNVYFSPNGEKILYTATAAVTLPDHISPPLPGSNSQSESRALEPGNVYVYDIKEDKNFLLFRQPAELPTEPGFSKIKLITNLNDQFNLDPAATPSAQSLLQVPGNLAATINNFRAEYSSFHFTNYQWFPTSNHILVNRDGSIGIVEYDGTNMTTLYAGQYLDNFVYPWPDGSKIVILTNLTNNPSLPPNLYSINLK